MPSSASEQIEEARRRFRRDVAEQLRGAAERAGLPARITMDDERVILQFDETSPEGALPRFTAIFGHDEDGEMDESVTLCVETDDALTTLLRLEWRNHAGLEETEALNRRLAELESRTDKRLSLGLRGLNAAADVCTGPYAGSDVIKRLGGDLKRAAAQLAPKTDPSPALVIVGRVPQTPPRAAERAEGIEDSGRSAVRDSLPGDVGAQRANVTEFLISSLMQAMQRDLAEAEGHFVGPGVAASVRGRFGRGMEWAMLGTAYSVEAQTNQIAVSSFLGSEAASWLYGLVGPVLIGGLASMSQSKTGKGAAVGLMMSWALAMATVAASETRFLDRAQGFFPKQAGVLTREHAVAAARIKKEVADADLRRLSAPLKETGSLLADAKKRWQAGEIMRAAKQEREVRERELAQARRTAIAAGTALSEEELRLREAMLGDPSRASAWWTLFAIFGVINLAGPLAISRVLERWRTDHAEAQARARDGHRKKAEVASLRSGPAAQAAHAMELLPALADRLTRGGVAPEVIAGLDLRDISQKAAERFDRGVNPRHARRRFFGAPGRSEGPG